MKLELKFPLFTMLLIMFYTLNGTKLHAAGLENDGAIKIQRAWRLYFKAKNDDEPTKLRASSPNNLEKQIEHVGKTLQRQNSSYTNIPCRESSSELDSNKFILVDILLDELPRIEVVSKTDPRITAENYLEGNLYLDPTLIEKRSNILKLLNREFHPTLLSNEDALQLFKEIQNPTDPLLKIINWNEKRGGCNHRTRQLSRWLKLKNIHHEEVYLGGSIAGNRGEIDDPKKGLLRVKSDPSISWPFHVAIVLTVEDPVKGPQKMVIDRALSSNHLISLNDWMGLMESEIPSQPPLELHHFGLLDGHAENRKILRLSPGEFDNFWDYSEIMKADRSQCIEQDAPKLLELK